MFLVLVISIGKGWQGFGPTIMNVVEWDAERKKDRKRMIRDSHLKKGIR